MGCRCRGPAARGLSRGLPRGPCLLGAASGAGVVGGHTGAPVVCVGPPPWAIHGEPHPGLCMGFPEGGSPAVLGPLLAGSVALVSRFVARVCKACVGLLWPRLGSWGSEASHAT